MVSGLHIGDALTDRLYDTSTLMTKHNGESAFGVLAGERVCVWGSG
jgi:hypothetical protein